MALPRRRPDVLGPLLVSSRLLSLMQLHVLPEGPVSTCGHPGSRGFHAGMSGGTALSIVVSSEVPSPGQPCSGLGPGPRLSPGNVQAGSVPTVLRGRTGHHGASLPLTRSVPHRSPSRSFLAGKGLGSPQPRALPAHSRRAQLLKAFQRGRGLGAALRRAAAAGAPRGPVTPRAQAVLTCVTELCVPGPFTLGPWCFVL